MKRILLVSVVVAASVVAACGGSSDPGAPGTGESQPSGATPPPATGTGDLPCEVVAALQSCQSCHGTRPSPGVPMSLVTYKDLTSPSPYYPTEMNVDRAIARMTDSNAPMPPTGKAPQSDVDALKNWRAAGMPSSACVKN